MLTRLLLQRSTSSFLNKSNFVSLGLNNYCTRYTETHEWVTLDGKNGCIGLTNYAQRTLGDIVFFETPELKSYSKDQSIGVVESVKAASDIYAPFTIKVTEINDEIRDEPELVNEDPYENWVCKFETSDTNEFSKLLSLQEYEKFIDRKER